MEISAANERFKILMYLVETNQTNYSSVSNNCVGWNKCVGWNFHPKLINVQAGIIVQVGKFLNI